MRLKKDGKKMMDLLITGTVRHEAERLIKHISVRKVQILYKHQGFKIINVSYFEENLSTIFKCTINVPYSMLP